MDAGRVRPSYFHGIWDGCELEVEFDADTIEDIIVHDNLNSTYIKMS